HQTIQRHSAAWQDSLRYRYPALDQLGGLRRITLNDNPRLGDSGSIRIAESLFDDLWVKAVDLQACNLSDRSAMTWLRVLTGTPSPMLVGKLETSQLPEECRGNHSLAVVDLRRNPNISREILRAVTERALLNSEGKQTESRVTQLEEQLNRESSRPPTTVLTKQILDAGDRVSPGTPMNTEVMEQLNELVRYVQPILGTLQSNPDGGKPLTSSMNLDQLRRHLQQLCVLVHRFNAGTEDSKTSSQPESCAFDVSHSERPRRHHLVHQKMQAKSNVSNSLNDVSVEPSHNSATRVLETADSYLRRSDDPGNNSMYRTSLNGAKADSLSSLDTSVEKEIPSNAP
ncbi:hypothetical protein X801_05666, partial [Opisthorchis viverrini]